MQNDDAGRGVPTRRELLRAGGALAAGSALAGCAGGGDTATTEPETASETAASAETTESRTSNGDGSYGASMAPMGEVTLDAPPEKVFVIFPQYADMAVALGRGDAVNSIYVPKMSGTAMNHYYARLDGVSFDWKGLSDPVNDGLTKERLYQLGSDVHLADPAWVSTQEGWKQSDADEIAKNVAPWFGNFYSGTHADPPKAYADAYRYYGLWEIFGRVARLFDEKRRYDALAGVHEDLLATIRERLPPKEERPTAVRVTLSDGTFYTYHLNEPGYWLADTRPLGAVDAFAEEDWGGQLWGSVGYEAMLEADPDVVLHLWGTTPNYDMANVRKKLRNHSVGSQLSAVRNDRVYAQGMRYQGPIMNLFQLEMTAKQLYPDEFGAWPGYADGEPYPEIPEEEHLFDREKVAAAVAGDV